MRIENRQTPPFRSLTATGRASLCAIAVFLAAGTAQAATVSFSWVDEAVAGANAQLSSGQSFGGTLTVNGTQSGSTITGITGGTLTLTENGTAILTETLTAAQLGTTLTEAGTGASTYLSTPPATYASVNGTLSVSPGLTADSLTISGMASTTDLFNIASSSALTSTIGFGNANEFFAAGTGSLTATYNLLTKALTVVPSGSVTYDLGYWAPTTVPLPAGLWLLLSGLGGVGLFSRRRIGAEPAIA